MRRRGRCVNGAHTSFWVLAGATREQLGCSTSKGFGTAVRRNRARRRLREAFLQVYAGGGGSAAIIGVAKPSSLALDFQTLKRTITGQLTQVGVPTRAGGEGTGCE